MRRLLIPMIAILALALPALASAKAGSSFRAQLHELNGSGASGSATVTVSGNTLTIHLVATGLENGPHLRHIHGGAATTSGQSAIQSSKCPTPQRDIDADGIISVAEGVPDYGPVIVNIGNFVTTGGTLDETITITPFNGAVLPLDKRAVVLHGMTGPNGYDASIPIVCGQLHSQP
jgi:CHRD domain